MKKILIILLAFIVLPCMSQKKISNMDAASTVNPDAVIPIVQGGANYKATKANFQKEILDSLAIHRTEIDNTEDSITIHRRELDSLQSSLSTANYKISILEGADIIAPGVDSAYILSTNDSVIFVLFDETLSADDNDSAVYAFSYTYGEGVGTIDSVVVGGMFAVVYSSINIPTDSVIYVTYTKPVSGGIHDESFNYTSNFTQQLAFNGTANVSYIAQAFWKFNGDLLDYYGVNNGTEVGTVPFTGDTALLFSSAGGNDAVSIPDIITGDHAFSTWVYMPSGVAASESFYLFTNCSGGTEDGFYCRLISTGSDTYTLTYGVGDGSNSTYTENAGDDIAAETWTNIVINVDVDGGSGLANVPMYIDGVLANNTASPGDSILGSPWTGPITVSGTAPSIANKPVPDATGFRDGAIIGEFILFDEMLSLAEIDSLSNISDRLWFTSSTPTGSYVNTPNILELIDYTGEPLGQISDVQTDSYFAGNVFAHGSNTYRDIVVWDGDTVERAILPAGTDYLSNYVRADLPGTYEEVWYSYNIWLQSGFYFEGGKIPGLACKNLTGSDETPDGGVYPESCNDPESYEATDGSSFRGLIKEIENSLGVYYYTHNMDFLSCSNPTYGNNFWNTGFTPGSWHNFTMRLVLNTVNTDVTDVEANGVLEFYRDGVCTDVVTGIIMRKYKAVKIDMYYKQIGYGGASPAPWRTVPYNVYMDDFTLWNWLPGHGYAKGNAANPVGTVIAPPNRKDE